MFHKAHNVVLLSSIDKLVVVREKLSRWLGDKNVNTAFNSVQADGVVRI